MARGKEVDARAPQALEDAAGDVPRGTADDDTVSYYRFELPLRQDQSINFALLRDMFINLVQKTSAEGEIGDILGANADHLRRLKDAFPNYVLAIMKTADQQRANFGGT